MESPRGWGKEETVGDALADIRSTFAAPAGKEGLRAFALFAVLLVLLAVIAGDLVFRSLSIGVLRERLDLGRNAAGVIAREVAKLGRVGGVIDYSRLRENLPRLRRLIEIRMEQAPYIRHVEVRDRFDVRVTLVVQEGVRRSLAAKGRLPFGWPAVEEGTIRIPLAQGGSRPEGEVRVGISEQFMESELEQLRRSLRIKVSIAGALAVGVLLVALFYVLRLIQKNRLLEQTRQSAARASYVGLLASGLAHEIRNPLNAMNMNLQMLEEELSTLPDSLRDDTRDLLESTKSEIQRLVRLVTNFLTYARPAEPCFEARDLNRVVREVVRLLEADFSQTRVTLRRDLEPLLPQVELDETQFKQALINLLVNARQVLEGGGTITVRTRAGSKGEAVVEVEDDGPGIAPEVRERIFEVFYSSRGGGTGLGLPIARQIVERHGGRIEVGGEHGKGSVFRIRLPRHQAAAPGGTA
jgi:signal transduction histidine kinase